MIKLENVTKKYVMGDNIVMALNGIDIHIDEGEFVAIVGPSGSGKSTLMNIIGCLDVVSSGYYELNRIPIQDYDKDELADIRNQQIGFVFQQFNLLNNFSALENVMMPMTYAKVHKKEREEKAHALLSLVGLSDRTGHKPTELSGGQQQRAVIARAIANKPRILIADEPTGNLDPQKSGEIIQLLERINREEKTTILMVTHDIGIVNQYKKRTIALEAGHIVADMVEGGYIQHESNHSTI